MASCLCSSGGDRDGSQIQRPLQIVHSNAGNCCISQRPPLTASTATGSGKPLRHTLS